MFVDFSKAFDYIHREKMEQKLLAFSLCKGTVTAIIMRCNTDLFDIVTGVLQGDTLAPYLFLICLLGTPIDFMKENSLI